MRIYDRILILYKTGHCDAAGMSVHVASWLEENGVETEVMEASQFSQSEAPFADCVVVLGGDGTILGISRKLAGKNIPIFGINFGRVGFLTTADCNNWKQRLYKAIMGQIIPRRCMALEWQLYRNECIVASGTAINDVVVSRGALARLVCMNVSINNIEMGILRCDGLIICTPLGSSGYSISAGGPLLYSSMDAIGIIAICPFLGHVSPLVVPSDTVFELRVVQPSPECYITIDGQVGQKLADNDVIRTKGWPGAVLLIDNDTHFYERLQSRGFTLEKPL